MADLRSTIADVRPIETAYAGYLFRSRTEARWAVFFDALGETWEYEREGYELPSGRYLPDFWLPRLRCWLEIKGDEPTPRAIRRCEDLALGTNAPVAIAWGLPYEIEHDPEHWTGDWWGERLRVFCADATDGSAGVQWWNECFWALDFDRRLCICSGNNHSSRVFLTPHSWSRWQGMTLGNDILGPVPESAIDAAKRARFEGRS